MKPQPKYGLHSIGGECQNCHQRYVKRSLYVPLPLNDENCLNCSGVVTYCRLGWKRYFTWMQHSSTRYLESVTVPSPKDVPYLDSVQFDSLS